MQEVCFFGVRWELVRKPKYPPNNHVPTFLRPQPWLHFPVAPVCPHRTIYIYISISYARIRMNFHIKKKYSIELPIDPHAPGDAMPVCIPNCLCNGDTAP